MLRKRTIADWDEDRLAKFVQALPRVQDRKDNTAPPASVAGAIADPGGAVADDGIFWSGFGWIVGKVTNARVAVGAAIAYSKLALTGSIIAADINAEASTLGEVLTSQGDGTADWGAGAGMTWTTFTPTWTGSVSDPSLGNGTLVGRYATDGDTLFWNIVLSPGTTTTFGTGTWAFAIPPGTPAGLSIGSALAYGTGPLYLGLALVSSVIEPLFDTGIASAIVPQAWGNGTPLVMSGFYETT